MSRARVWKPLDVGGLRLYKVELRYWYKMPDNPDKIDLYKAQHGYCDTYIVASTAPRIAADYIEQIYKEMYDANDRISMWTVSGFALNVSIPKHWAENGVPCLDCEPERFGLEYVNKVMEENTKNYCCFWCHQQSAEMFINKRSGHILCNSCRVDPVLNKFRDKCGRVHKVEIEAAAQVLA